MILLDLNQLVFSTISVQSSKQEINEDLIRHIVLNCIRLHRNKFYDKYGEIVIATDNKHYWRRDVFPYYKANRKKDREKSSLNWPLIFECMSKIKTEIKETFPYKFIDVYGAEADDVISVLIEAMPYTENALIISGDKDFIQLQTVKPYVDQYDPARKRWLTHNNPAEYLEEHIIKGDRGDGVPNIRTPDSALALPGAPPLEGDQRNKMLIDLTQIPSDVKMAILEEYEKPVKGKRSCLFGYFFKHNLKNLMETIHEF